MRPILAHMTLMPKKVKTEARLVLLGKYVTEKTVLRELRWQDVPDVYEESGEAWPASSPQQVSKLRAFWKFGNKFGKDALLYLAGWKPPPRGSTYTALVHDVRVRNTRGWI